MSGIKNFSDVEKSLNDYLSEYQRKLELWSNIQVVTKKDGTQFKQMNKNFIGAVYGCDNYSDMNHAKLFVSGYVDGTWTTDEIDVYLYVDTLSKDDPRRDQGTGKISYMRETYLLTIEEIKARIGEQIVFCKKQIASYEKQLKLSEKAWTNYFLAVSDATKQLKIDSGCDGEMFENSLFHAVVDGVKYTAKLW